MYQQRLSHVHEQGLGHVRHGPKVHGLDVELVPEDVAAVRLPGEAAGGHPGVQVHGGVDGRGRADHVVRVEARDALVVPVALDLNVRHVPRRRPRLGVRAEHGTERPGGREGGLGGRGRAGGVGAVGIEAGVDGDEFLDRVALALARSERELFRDDALLDPAAGVRDEGARGCAVPDGGGLGRGGDLVLGYGGFRHEGDPRRAAVGGRHNVHVVLLEVAVPETEGGGAVSGAGGGGARAACDNAPRAVVVDDGAVDGAPHCHSPGVVQRSYFQLDAAQVGRREGHEPRRGHPGAPAFGIFDDVRPGRDARLHVEGVLVLANLVVAGRERVGVLGVALELEGEREPVGAVDHIVVGDGTPGDVRIDFVENSGEVPAQQQEEKEVRGSAGGGGAHTRTFRGSAGRVAGSRAAPPRPRRECPCTRWPCS